MTHYNLHDLRTCLQNFQNKGGQHETCGAWKIAKGDYDLNWKLYHHDTAVIQCIGNTIKIIRKTSDDVIRTILNEYNDLRRYFRVSCTMIYNGSVIVAAKDEDDAIETVNFTLNHTNGDEFPDSGNFGGVEFTFGEATADEAETTDEEPDSTTSPEKSPAAENTPLARLFTATRAMLIGAIENALGDKNCMELPDTVRYRNSDTDEEATIHHYHHLVKTDDTVMAVYNEFDENGEFLLADKQDELCLLSINELHEIASSLKLL